MSSENISALEKEFTQRLREACETSIGLGYNPQRMLTMLQTSSGRKIAKEFVAQSKIHDGLVNVLKTGRPELAMENIMLEEYFRPLFTKRELIAARWRVDQAKLAA